MQPSSRARWKRNRLPGRSRRLFPVPPGPSHPAPTAATRPRTRGPARRRTARRARPRRAGVNTGSPSSSTTDRATSLARRFATSGTIALPRITASDASHSSRSRPRSSRTSTTSAPVSGSRPLGHAHFFGFERGGPQDRGPGQVGAHQAGIVRFSDGTRVIVNATLIFSGSSIARVDRRGRDLGGEARPSSGWARRPRGG